MHTRSRIPLEMLNIRLIRIGRLRMPGIVTMQSMVGRGVIVGQGGLVITLLIMIIAGVNTIVPWIMTLIDLLIEGVST